MSKSKKQNKNNQKQQKTNHDDIGKIYFTELLRN